MFTRNIRTTVQLGKSGAKWDTPSEGGFNLMDVNQKTPDELLKQANTLIDGIKDKDSWATTDWLRMQQLRDIMRRLGDENSEKRNQIIKDIQEAKKEASNDDQKRLSELEADFEKAYTKADSSKEGSSEEIKSATVLATKTEQKNVGEPRVVGMKEQAAALVKVLGIKEEDTTANDIITDLKATNIQSLLTVVTNPANKQKIEEYIKNYNTKFASLPSDVGTSSFNEQESLKDLGYTPNGSVWFGGETAKIKNFFESYIGKANTLSQIGDYARAGLATTVAFSDTVLLEKVTDKDSFIQYLGNVPNARYRKSDVEQVFSAMKDSKDFAKNIANTIGIETVTTVDELISAFKSHPEYKARFFDAINTNGANRMVGIQSFLEGKGADKAQEKANEIQKTYTDLAKKAVDTAKKDLENAETPEEKQKIQAVLDEYNKKGESWFTGEIRKVAEGAFANIGRNANIVGVGMSFETFIKGLTVTLGAGVGEGKLGAGAVVRYDIASGKLTETEKNIIEGNVGIGTSVFPAFIPFVDGGVRAIDKVQTFGMNGRGAVDSVGVHTMLFREGGIAALSFMNERQSEIEQGRAKMTEAVKQLAELNPRSVTPEEFKNIVAATGLKATDMEVANWVQNIQSLYARNPGADSITSDARAILLMGLVESEVEKAGIQEANNDKDARSFKGWSIGVGHILGVTFPVAGIAFKEGKMSYAHPDTLSTGATATSSIAIGSSSENGAPEAQPEAIAKAVREQGDISEYASVIYVLNRSSQYKSFNKAILQIANQDYNSAFDTLDAFAKKDKRIADILIRLDAKNHPENLQVINTYTYGTEKVKNKSEGINQSTYNEARKATMIAEEREWAARWNTENEPKFSAIENHAPIQLSVLIPNQEISTTVFATPKGGAHRLDKYEGSILVSNSLLDANENQKEALMQEHAAAIQKQVVALKAFVALSGKDDLLIDEVTYKSMLTTGNIPESWKPLGLEFVGTAKPQFFEARAMAAGNVCLNKVEGIAYPRFTYTLGGGSTTTQEASRVNSLDIPGGTAIYDEIFSGIGVSGYNEKPKETKPEENTPNPDTTPGEDPVPPPDPKPNPITVPSETPTTPSPAPAPAPVAPPAPAPVPVVPAPPQPNSTPKTK